MPFIDELNKTVVAYWNVKSTEGDVPAEVEIQQYTNGNGESVIEPDRRQRVPPADIMEGGKYRC